MTWFQNLSVREKVLLTSLLPLALAAAAYQFAWLPLHSAQNRYAQQIAGFRQVTDLASLSGDTATRVAAPSPRSTVPLATRITTSAEGAGVVLRRIETESDGVRVTLADTTFSQLTLWLAEMEQDFSVVVTAIEIDRRPEPGIVSARILLEDL